MEPDGIQTHFSKSVMAGLFAGIIATLLNLVFNVFYREYTLFQLSDIINVSSIIFVTCLALTIAGIIFYLMDNYLKRGMMLYIILFSLLTLLCVRASFHIHRSDNPLWNKEFSQLFLGIVIISGLMTTVLIPYMVRKETDII